MEWDFEAESVDAETFARCPTDYQGAYAQGADGKYALQDAFKPFAKSVAGLGKALKGERTVTQTLRGQKDATSILKEVFGEDVQDAETAKTRYAEITQQLADKAKVDPEKIKADIEKTYATRETELNGRVEKMQGTLDKYLVENAARASLAGAKGNATLLLPHIKGQAKVVEHEGEYVVRVLDADGQYRGDGRGGFMTVDDLVAELKKSKDYSAAFESEAKPGGGPVRQAPGAAVRDQRRQDERDQRTPAQKIADGLKARRAGN